MLQDAFAAASTAKMRRCFCLHNDSMILSAAHGYDKSIFAFMCGKTDAIVDSHAINSPQEYNHNPNVEVLDNSDILIAWSCALAEGDKQKLCLARKTASGWKSAKEYNWGNNVYIPVIFQPLKPGEPYNIFFTLN